MRSSLLLPVIGLAATFGACASGPEPAAKKPGPPAATVDVCEGETKPPWRSYDGPLAGVRCEQEQFARMATIADHLNVDCGFCHVPKDASGKAFDWPMMTEKKETALWMHRTFFGGLKRTDGKPTECRNCHIDKAGKPSAKFLGTPRDVPFAVEWMTTRLTNDFVHLDGSKLKCKSCHEGTWGTPAFQTKVIPKELPFAPKPAVPASAEPTGSSAPSAAPSGSAAPIPPIPSGTPRE